MTDYQGTPSIILRMLDLLTDGCSKREIEQQLSISPATAERYLRSLTEDWRCVVHYDRKTNCYRLVDAGVFCNPRLNN